MSNYNKIYLLGFMGSGKSSVGSLLAKKLDYDFIDLDLFIENRYKKPIEQIFSDDGEEYFRKIESESLVEVSNLEGKQVVSTGGGVVLSETNWEMMNNSGTTVYLEAELDTIMDRIKSDSSRPLLDVDDPFSEAKKLLAERTNLYKKSDLTINTDTLTEEQVANEVIKILKNRL